MNKPKPTRSLSELASGFLAETFKRQGFASTELVTRWPDIVGAEIAAHAEPLKLQWQRTQDGEPSEPATLVLRVEGPAAIEIQHQSERHSGADQPLLRLAGGRPARFAPGSAQTQGQTARRRGPTRRRRSASPPR